MKPIKTLVASLVAAATFVLSGGGTAQAAAAKVVVENSGKTLRFVYDTVDYGVEGTDWYSVYAAETQEPSADPPWYARRTTVTKVVFDASFKDYRPRHCGCWFFQFTSLAAIDGIGNLDVSSATDLRCMFVSCTALTSLDLSGFDTAKVTDMSSMFYNCQSLKTIYVSDKFTTANVAQSPNMFASCTALVGGNGTAYSDQHTDKTYARIDKAGTHGYFTPPGQVVVEDGGATLRFVCDGEDHGVKDKDWYSLAESSPSSYPPWRAIRANVTKAVFDASFTKYRPTHCDYWFSGFSSLAAVKGLGNLDTSEATSMKYMFSECPKLKSLVLSEFNTAKAKDMSAMFYGCSALKTIYASAKFTTANTTVSCANMFTSCTSLVGGNGTAYSDQHTDKTYARIDKAGVPGYFSAPAQVVVEDDGATLRFVCDGAEYLGTWYSVADAEDQDPDAKPAWYVQSITVTKVVFDASFVGYRPKHCGRWFDGFTYLATIEGLENLDTSAATSTQSMFANCFALTSLDVSNFDTSKAVTMSGMFAGCPILETIYASEKFVTEQATDADYIFYGCMSLVGGMGTAFDPDHIDKTYARIDKAGAPGYFSAMPKAVVENGGTTLRFVCDGADHGVKGVDWYSVLEAEALNPWDKPPWYENDRYTVTNAIIDATFADYQPKHCGSWFYSFRQLKSIEGLGNLDVSAVTSTMYMFCYCSSLTSLDLSGFRTTSLTDARNMFRGCTSLKTIYAADGFSTANVTQDENMFLACTSLVGGNGTAYSDQHTDKTYARIDKAGAPGYFTGPTEAKVVVENGGKTLRFVCDGADHGVKGVDWYSVLEAEELDPMTNPPWVNDCCKTVETVVFDPTFKSCRPKHCGSWFYNCGSLSSFSGMTNLDVSAATSLAYMFSRCFALPALDLRRFDTANVTNTMHMFANCTNLVTIWATESFVVDGVTESVDMFYGCKSLVGGKGTTYDSGNRDKTYARIDGTPAMTHEGTLPGYFTYMAIPVSFGEWAAAQGLTGADAAWDAKPAVWGGKWANAFIYKYGEGLADGSLAIMNIVVEGGNPVITTTPAVDGHNDFAAAVIGAGKVDDWTAPVVLERSGDDWTLPQGEEANFFRVKLSN